MNKEEFFKKLKENFDPSKLELIACIMMDSERREKRRLKREKILEDLMNNFSDLDEFSIERNLSISMMRFFEAESLYEELIEKGAKHFGYEKYSEISCIALRKLNESIRECQYVRFISNSDSLLWDRFDNSRINYGRAGTILSNAYRIKRELFENLKIVNEFMR